MPTSTTDGVTRMQQFVTYDNGTSIRQGYDGTGLLDYMQEYRDPGGTNLAFYPEFDQLNAFPTWHVSVCPRLQLFPLDVRRLRRRRYASPVVANSRAAILRAG